MYAPLCGLRPVAERWVRTLGFELVLFDGKYYVMRRGGRHVRTHIPDDEIALRLVAEAVDYDEAVGILRALRVQSNTDTAASATLTASPES